MALSRPQPEIDWFRDASDSTKGLIGIFASKQPETDKPFVVTKLVDSSGKTQGAALGYFERRRDTVWNMSCQELRDRLKDGLRFSSIERRLDTIEEAISSLRPAATTSVPVVDAKTLQKRIDAARVAVGLDGASNYVLAATPGEGAKIPGLFLSNSPVLQQLRNPPQLRRNGFDLEVGSPPGIVAGTLRRSVLKGYKLLEFWQDGTLIFVAPGDGGFLSWPKPAQSGRLIINTWVLLESVYLFADLLVKLTKEAIPEPAYSNLFLVMGSMSVDGMRCRLQPYVPRPNQVHYDPGSEAPGDSVVAHSEVDLPAATLGKVAYSLLGNLYVKFGFEADKVPMVNYTKNPPEVEIQCLVEQ